MKALDASALDRIEALARGATPEGHAWADAPDSDGMKRVKRCECGVLRGIREDSSTVLQYLLPGGRRITGGCVRPATPPCAVSFVRMLNADTVLALVEAARRGMRQPDPREIGSSEAFAELLDDFRTSVAWDTVTDQGDRLLAHEAALRARADGTPYPPSCPSCGHSPHREDPDGKCWYGGVGGCACAGASD